MVKQSITFTPFKEYADDQMKGQLRACYGVGRDASFNEFWEKWLDGLEAKKQRDIKSQNDRIRRIDEMINPEMRHHKFYRVSLPDDIDKVKEQIWRLSNLKYFRDDIAFVLEYHSENFPEGGNLHIHIITHTKVKDSKIRSDLARVFKVLIEKVETCKYRPDLYHKRCGYVRGDKAHHKDEFCEKDKRWRDENELQDYYNFGFFH